jgi:16S rRNA (guanine527-N7)-methyltransferase
MAEARKTSADLRRRIGQRARKAHLDLPGDIQSRMADYLALLQFWNQKVNLTALTDPDEMIDRLVVEPAMASRWLPDGPVTLMDVGSGGGSPAIPLRLCAPGIRLLMVEAKTRKAAFLREAARQLSLTNTEVESRRFEELLARPDLNESVDVVSVRAVRVDRRVLFQLQAFLRPGGQVWLFTTRVRPGDDSFLPELRLEANEPLLDEWGSRLCRLRKASFA